MATQTTSHSPFLGLPPELRNRVYRLVLVAESDSEIVVVDKATLPQRQTLLHTCTTIRNEATSIFYAENKFLLPLDGATNEASFRWLKTLGSARASLIHPLVLEIGYSEPHYRAIAMANISTGPPEHGYAWKQYRMPILNTRDDVAKIQAALGAAHEAGLKGIAITVRVHGSVSKDGPVCELEYSARNLHCTRIMHLMEWYLEELQELDARQKESQE